MLVCDLVATENVAALELAIWVAFWQFGVLLNDDRENTSNMDFLAVYLGFFSYLVPFPHAGEVPCASGFQLFSFVRECFKGFGVLLQFLLLDRTCYCGIIKWPMLLNPRTVSVIICTRVKMKSKSCWY